MSATRLPILGLVCCILALGALPRPAAGGDGPEKPTKAKQTGPKDKVRESVAEMIDALGNRNEPPKLLDDARSKHRLPLFPDDYDWKEQARAGSAFGRIRREQTTEMWDELVRRMDDDRYCLTLMGTNGDGCIGNYPVGYFCGELAYDWLVGVYEPHLPRDPARDGWPLRLYIGPIDVGLKKWRKERADKQLYELQIEVCEEAIQALEKAAKVPRREKDRARKEIEAEIATLKKTKRPIITGYRSDCPHPAYTEKDAKEVREYLAGKRPFPGRP
jgi:hypothetical protein